MNRAPNIVGTAALVCALLLVSGCAANTPAPTVTPTKTQLPTFPPAPPPATAPAVPPTATETPQPTPTEPPTAAPTATSEPTASPEPTATPRPAAARPTARPVQPTAPPATSDPCAGIGGDGCKWRETGRSTADNGGQELKLQFLFIHGGRNEPQGSYFVWMEKDGVKLPIPDSVRSVANASSQGTLGIYNYEFALGVSQLPGNTVAGNYVLWVLDGNGERDSRNISFSIPANQGLLWIRFDQS